MFLSRCSLFTVVPPSSPLPRRPLLRLFCFHFPRSLLFSSTSHPGRLFHAGHAGFYVPLALPCYSSVCRLLHHLGETSHSGRQTGRKRRRGGGDGWGEVGLREDVRMKTWRTRVDERKDMSEGDVGRKKYEMWKLNKYTNRRKRIFKCLIQKQNLIIYMYTIKMIVTLSDLKLLSLLCYTACSSTDSIKGHTLLTIQEGYKTYSPSFLFTHASSVCKQEWTKAVTVWLDS